MAIQATSSDHIDDIIKSNKLVFVVFSRKSCSKCNELVHIINGLELHFSSIMQVAMVFADTLIYQDIKNKYGKGPSSNIYCNGLLIKTIEGIKSEFTYRSEISKVSKEV